MADVAVLRAEIVAADRLRREAMMTNDIAALEQIYAPDCGYIHLNGLRETGAEYIRSLGGGGRYRSLELPDPFVRIIGDVAIVTGTQQMEINFKAGGVGEFKSEVVLVWQKVGSRWVVIHFQGTKALEN